MIASSSTPANIKTRPGFTLIELLVVVAIIALLISILLPSLGKARQTAYTARCAANMRGIGIGLIAYHSENNGRHIFSTKPGASIPGYANGFFWATELAKQKYLSAPNALTGGGAWGTPTSNSIFYCPSSLLQRATVVSSTNTYVQAGVSPRDPENAKCNWVPTGSGAGGAVMPGDFSVYSWYSLNMHNPYSGNNPESATGSSTGGATPFIYWDITNGMAGDMGTIQTSSTYKRSDSQITAPGRMVMIVETPNEIWDSPTPGFPPSYACRLRGNHGEPKNGGIDGFTNFAFFDGHVARYSTVKYSTTGIWYVDANGRRSATVQDTLFHLQQQK